MAKGGRWLEVSLLKNIKEKAAMFQWRNELQAVSNLYQQSPTPYPGQITQLGACDPQLAPQRYTISPGESDGKLGGKLTGEAVVGGASARKTMGACQPHLIKKIGFVFFTYDSERKTLIKVRGFENFGFAGLSSKENAGKIKEDWLRQTEKVKKKLEVLLR